MLAKHEADVTIPGYCIPLDILTPFIFLFFFTIQVHQNGFTGRFMIILHVS